jgi:putative membrane protein insertion efficiency factor
MKRVLILAIRGYRYFLSPWWGNQCRFDPSCSEYAIRAIEEHGALRGTGLAVRRLSKCHPLQRVGYDPVP